jgi:hypothetical protein
MEVELRPGEDRELAALRTIQRALSGLDEGAARRITQWLSDRYGTGLVDSVRGSNARQSGQAAPPQDIADLYHSASPSTEYEKALVGAYWFHRVRGQTDVDAQQVNAELKQLGFGIRNITVAFGDLMRRRPQLAIQTGKGGPTKQARKRYRLTGDGLRVVEAMLAKARNEQGSPGLPA